MKGFNPDDYGPAFAEVLAVDRCRELGPGTPNRDMHDRLRALSVEAAFAGGAVADADMARACLSGAWLLNDFLDESHRISQGIGTTSGSFWHGIMHRREPDYSNSKYWFRRVGEHSVFGPLAEAARELAGNADPDEAAAFLADQTAWDAFRFVDLCQAAARGPSANESLCRQIQQAECELLFDHCYQRAIGA